jgi:hypothetical protein
LSFYVEGDEVFQQQPLGRLNLLSQDLEHVYDVKENADGATTGTN